MDMTTALDTIKQVLREQGLDDNGASPHSWRCEHPDRYPDFCDCVDAMARALLDALAPYEYTAWVPGYAPGTIDENFSPPVVPATHRRRVYIGPYERMPEGEEREAGSLTFGHLD